MDRPPYLLVATPCYGGMVTSTFTTSMLAFQKACDERGLRWAYALESGDSLITRVRSNLMAHFLDNPEGTHLLFIDADIGWKPEQVFRLLDFNKEVAAGAYPLKTLDWQKIGRAVSSGKEPHPSLGLNYVGILEEGEKLQTRDGFATAKFVGNGFLMVTREALLRLSAAHPELRYRNLHTTRRGTTGESPNTVALFETMIEPETRAYLPEDFAFCQRWRDIGGEIWLDMQSALTHVGTMPFVGSMARDLG